MFQPTSVVRNNPPKTEAVPTILNILKQTCSYNVLQFVCFFFMYRERESKVCLQAALHYTVRRKQCRGSRHTHKILLCRTPFCSVGYHRALCSKIINSSDARAFKAVIKTPYHCHVCCCLFSGTHSFRFKHSLFHFVSLR